MEEKNGKIHQALFKYELKGSELTLYLFDSDNLAGLPRQDSFGTSNRHREFLIERDDIPRFRDFLGSEKSKIAFEVLCTLKRVE